MGLLSTWPKGGPTEGGTRVTVVGGGFNTTFASTVGVRCRFDEVVVVAEPEEVTDTTVVCMLPPREGTGTVHVTVALNGLNYDSPLDGSALLHGRHGRARSGPCDHAPLQRPAYVRRATPMGLREEPPPHGCRRESAVARRCLPCPKSPTARPSSLQDLVFTYYAPPRIEGLEPPGGPVLGGTVVSLHGANLSSFGFDRTHVAAPAANGSTAPPCGTTCCETPCAGHLSFIGLDDSGGGGFMVAARAPHSTGASYYHGRAQLVLVRGKAYTLVLDNSYAAGGGLHNPLVLSTDPTGGPAAETMLLTTVASPAPEPERSPHPSTTPNAHPGPKPKPVPEPEPRP